MMAKVAVRNRSLDKNAIHAGKTKSSEANLDLQPKIFIPPRFTVLWRGLSDDETTEISSEVSVMIGHFMSKYDARPLLNFVIEKFREIVTLKVNQRCNLTVNNSARQKSKQKQP